MTANAFLPYPPAYQKSGQGPLSGLRLAVKDLFDIAGYPSSAGNPFLLAQSGIKTETAPLVRQLLDAGAHCVGKTKTDELAYSLTGLSCCFGNPVNPTDPGLIPGGSSSGTAVAIAADLADIGLGTDTSGSIRLPAAVNGLIGWRPTHCLLSIEGCRPLAPSFDTAAFAVRNFETLEMLMMGCGMEAEANEIVPRFVIPTDLLALCSPTVDDAFLGRTNQFGNAIQMDRILESLAEDALEAFNLILQREAWLTNRSLHDEHGAVHTVAIRHRIEAGRMIPCRDVLSAQGFRLGLRDGILSRFPPETIFVFPTLGNSPPRIDASEEEMDGFRHSSMAMLCVAGLIGGPQVSVPLRGEAAGISISFLSALPVDRWLAAAAKCFMTKRT